MMATLALRSLKTSLITQLMQHPAGEAMLLNLKRLWVLPFKRTRRHWAWQRYFKQQTIAGHPVSIHLGSHKPIAGWFNTSFHRDSLIEGNAFIDVTQPLPFPDNVADAVFHEHLLEHLSPEDGLAFLAECFRVLKPGGWFRMGLPNLLFYTQLLAHSESGTLTPDEQDFILWYNEMWEPLPPICRLKAPVESVVNGLLYDYGHRWMIPPSMAIALLKHVGFGEITPVHYGYSDHPGLNGIDRHGDTVQSHRFAALETWCVEARKPEMVN